MSYQNQEVKTYSLFSVQRRNKDGTISGAWIQDCVGTLDDAVLRASRTSHVNSGVAIALALKDDIGSDMLHLNHYKKPITIVMAASQNGVHVKCSEEIIKEVSLSIREMISAIDEDADREISANERVQRIRQQLGLLLESMEGRG